MKLKNIVGILMILIGLYAFTEGVAPKITVEFIIFITIFLIGLYVVVKDEIQFHKKKRGNKSDEKNV